MRAAVARAGKVWSVTVTPDDGAPVVYRYRSEAQARFFAAVFSLEELDSDGLPRAHRARRSRKKIEFSEPEPIRDARDPELDRAFEAAFSL